MIRTWEIQYLRVYESSNLCTVVNVKLLDKEEINEFCFTNERDLTPSSLHGNSIMWPVEYAFFIAIHASVQISTLSICYLQRYSSFWEFYFVLVSKWRHTLLICMFQKPEHLWNEIGNWETQDAILFHFENTFRWNQNWS